MSFLSSGFNTQHSLFYLNQQPSNFMPLYPQTNQLFFPSIEFPIENQFNWVYVNFPLQQTELSPPEIYYPLPQSPSDPVDQMQQIYQPEEHIEESERKKSEKPQNAHGPIFKRDRNIKSNAVKLFLKYARRDLCIKNGYHQKLLRSLKLDKRYSLKEFKQDLEKVLPESQNYIKIGDIHILCLNFQKVHSENFVKMLRISLKKFLKETIYLFNSKYTRTKQRVRREQIKACLSIYEEVFTF